MDWNGLHKMGFVLSDEEDGESDLVICGVFALEGDDNKEETDIGDAEEVEVV